MIAFEGRWICAACKPTFVQQLKEGCLAPVPLSLPDGFQERPLGFVELVSLTWALLRRDWFPIGALALLVAVPVNLILLATEPGDEVSLGELGRHVRMVQFLETVIGVLASLGIARIVSERLQGRTTTFGRALLHGLTCWLPGIWTGMLGTIIISLLFLALIVPGVIWMGYYSFATTVVSLRALGGKRALDYSKALVRGRWWAVSGRLIGLVCVSMVPAVAVEIPIAFAPESAALSFVSYMLTDLFYAFVSVGATVLFLNLDAIQSREQASKVAPQLP